MEEWKRRRFLMKIQNEMSRAFDAVSAFRTYGSNPATKHQTSPAAAVSLSKEGTAKKDGYQEQMQRLQDRIAELKANDKMDAKTKESLMENLQLQMDELQKQQAKAEDGKEKDDDKSLLGAVKHAPKKEGDPAGGKGASGTDADSMEAIISAGTGMAHLAASDSIRTRAEADADLQAAQLNHEVNHPVEALRLKDQGIIQKRQAGIDALRSTGDKAAALSQEIMENAQAQQGGAASAASTQTAQPSSKEEPQSSAKEDGQKVTAVAKEGAEGDAKAGDAADKESGGRSGRF